MTRPVAMRRVAGLFMNRHPFDNGRDDAIDTATRRPLD